MAVAIASCACAALAREKPVFSDNFESGKIDTAKWDQRVEGTATIAVEKVDGAQGKYALHVHYPDGAARSYALVVATHLPDSVKSHFFGRAYMKITPTLGNTHNPLIFAGESGWPLSKFNEIGTYRGTWMPSYQENKSPAGHGRGEVVYHAEDGPPMDRWFLLEWEFNDYPSAITFWVDGKPVESTMNGQKVETVKFAWPKGSETVNNLVGGFVEFGFGARVWGAPPKGFDVYYDNIAIGTKRLGSK